MKNADIEGRYREQYRPLYESLAARVASLLTRLLADRQIPVSQIEHRAKTVASFLDKVRRKGYANPIEQVKDLAGVRVVTYQ